MNHLTTPSPNMMMAMIDSGANVNLGPPSLATDLGLQLCPHIDTRQIGTAHSNSKLVILGWIFPTGFTGPIAIVHNCTHILISTIQLQSHGMGVYMPPHETICSLTAHNGIFIDIIPCPVTHLYFIHIHKLLASYHPLHIDQPGYDDTSPTQSHTLSSHTNHVE